MSEIDPNNTVSSNNTTRLYCFESRSFTFLYILDVVLMFLFTLFIAKNGIHILRNYLHMVNKTLIILGCMYVTIFLATVALYIALPCWHDVTLNVMSNITQLVFFVIIYYMTIIKAAMEAELSRFLGDAFLVKQH